MFFVTWYKNIIDMMSMDGWARTGIVAFVLACVLIPLIHIVAASFSNPALFVAHKGILLWPEGFSVASYQAVFKNTFLWTGYANTLFVVIVGTLLNVLLSMVAAYCLSRKRVAAGPTIMKLLVFTMYFSGGMIPLYLVVKGVGLYGSRWALILPSLVDTYNLIIMRTVCRTLWRNPPSWTVPTHGRFCGKLWPRWSSPRSPSSRCTTPSATGTPGSTPCCSCAIRRSTPCS